MTFNRRFYASQQILHQNMIAIPFFYSPLPTQTIAVQGVSQAILNKFHPLNLMQKLYYRSNKPIVTKIISFKSIEEAESFTKSLVAEIRQNEKSTQKKRKYVCQYCRDISEFGNILFQPGKAFVLQPESSQMKSLIDEIARTVVMIGPEIQEKVKRVADPLLLFLNERTLSLQHIYYRWRVYSYLQGDGDKKYRSEPFQILKEGIFWYPPLLTNPHSYPLVMSAKQVKFFTQSLEKMERRKFAIEELMVFALCNINYAVHISSIIIIQLFSTLNTDPLPSLYLISDILFNSPTHVYKDVFQTVLPLAIYKFVLLQQNQQLKQPNQKLIAGIENLIEIWQKKFVFEDSFTKGLTFLLQLRDISKLYTLKDYPEHQRIRQIFGGENYLTELEKNCIENGIPFFPNKENEAKLFLNALFWSNEELSDKEPSIGKYDGDAINQRQLAKIQSKGLKVVACEGLPTSMLFQKNWRARISQTSLSQDL